MSNQSQNINNVMLCEPVIIQIILLFIVILLWVYLTYGQNIFHTYFLITPEDNRNMLISIVLSIALLFLLILLCMNGLTDLAWLFLILPYAIKGTLMLAKKLTVNNQPQLVNVHFHRGPLGAPEV